MDLLQWINIFIPDRLVNNTVDEESLLFGHYERTIDGHGINISITVVAASQFKSSQKQPMIMNDIGVGKNLVCLGRLNQVNDAEHFNDSVHLELNLRYNDNNVENQSIPFVLESIRLTGKPFMKLDKVSFILYDTYRLMRCQSFDIYRPGNRYVF